jgi:uncharacterized membrane protein
MTTVSVALVAATFLVSVVAGFLFAFAVVVMPGIRTLDDGGFIRSFQRMDGVIQRGDPLFGLVFIGSIVSLVAAAVLGAPALAAFERSLLLAAGGIYVAGVLVPTGTINVPLNNRLQRLDVDALDARERSSARQAFEPRWNRWNRVRTGLACASAALLTSLLIIL